MVQLNWNTDNKRIISGIGNLRKFVKEIKNIYIKEQTEKLGAWKELLEFQHSEEKEKAVRKAVADAHIPWNERKKEGKDK